MPPKDKKSPREKPPKTVEQEYLEDRGRELNRAGLAVRVIPSLNYLGRGGTYVFSSKVWNDKKLTKKAKDWKDKKTKDKGEG